MSFPVKIDTLLVSDVHIGSDATRVRDCHDLIQSFRRSKHAYDFRRLILLGDIFDSMDMERVRKYEWDFLGNLRAMTDEKCGVEVVWIRGNHDPKVIKLISSLMGVRAYERYRWQVGATRCFAMHGDQFDQWVLNIPKFAMDIPDWVYYAVQKIDGPKHHISRFIKETSKEFTRHHDAVAEGIVRYVRKRRIPVDAVFCGHTHIAEKRFFAKENIWYYNTGCWTGQELPTYITIDVAGAVKTHEYHG